MRWIISFLFLFFSFILSAQDAKLMVIEKDTIVAVPIRYLPIINGVFVENDYLKKEVSLKDSLILVDTKIIQNKDFQLESWKRQELIWADNLKKEKGK